MRYRHGRILNVFEHIAGAGLDGDHASGVTTLQLDSEPWDFDEDGGFLTIDDNDKFEYTEIDDDAQTITLATVTTTSYVDGKPVRVWPLTKVRWAEVLWEDEEDDDVGVVRVPHFFKTLLPTGRRRVRRNQESVSVRWDGMDWVLVDVYGAPQRITRDDAPPERIFRYTAEGIAADGYRGVKLRGYAGTATGVKARVGVAPTSTATFKVLLSGATVATLMIQAGKKASGFTEINQTFDEHNAWRVEHTSGDAAGPNLRVYVFVTLDTDLEVG